MNTDGSQAGTRVNPRIGALRRFAAEPKARPAVERCDLCSERIPEQHRHLLEREGRKIVCACDSCALRFEGVIGGRFSLIPRDTRRLADFQLSDAQWADFSLPIDLAFFFDSTPANRVVALYPSPAGAVESLLTLATWNSVAVANPVLKEMRPDVEALLVNRCGGQLRCYLAPIDVCYHLVGLIRHHWTGLSGGSEVWREIDAFFRRLDPAALPPTAEVRCA